MAHSARWVAAGLLAASAGTLSVVRPHPDPASPARPTSQAPDAATSGPSGRERAGSPRRRDPSVVGRGLDWLHGRQRADGSWGEPATTGLALLAFSGGGETWQSGSYKSEIRRGLDALVAGQDADGCLVPRDDPRLLRDHALAAIALVEAYGMTQGRWLEEPARRAVAFAKSLRRPGGAWNLPAPHDDEIDVEATAWTGMLVKSAELAEIDADPVPLREAAAAFDALTDLASGRVRTPPGTDPAVTSDAATAIGLLLRLWAGRSTETERALDRAADFVATRWRSASGTDLRFAYFGGLSMFAVCDQRFLDWLPAWTDFATTGQRKEGPQSGSWDPPGDEADRLPATVIHLLAAETFFGPVGHASMRARRR